MQRRVAVIAVALFTLIAGGCSKDSDQRVRASSDSSTTTSSTETSTTSTTLVDTTLATSVPVTVRPATTTTRPTTTTTAKPAVAPDQASVTLVNNFSAAVDLKINGQHWRLNPGQRVGPVGITPAASGNDVIEVTRADTPTCGVGDAQNYFDAGRRYTVSVVAKSDCGKPAPGFDVSPA